MNFNKILAYTLRILNKNRVYSAINLLGLSLGLCVFTLIVLFVRYEFGYDKYHANLDKMYRIIRDAGGDYLGSSKYAIAAAPLAEALHETVKEADHITRIARGNNFLVQAQGNSFFEEQYFAVDPEYFKIFTTEVIAGQANKLLTDPANVVLTESMAVKYFGSARDAIGKSIIAERGKVLGDFLVQAVIRDIPFQSHFRPKILFQFEAIVKATQASDLTSWGNNNYWIYFTLQPGVDIRSSEQALNAYVKPQLQQDNPPVISFQPVADVYLGDKANFDLATVGDATRLYVFLCIGVLVLSIACINYINMATARASNRAKEIGIRKVTGALRVDLILQFLFEAVLSTVIATVIALITIVLILPAYNQFLVKEISLEFLLEPASLFFAGSLVAGVALISGAYPAFLFSSFKPIHTLKGSFKKSHNSSLRNALVVFQFIVSGTLVFGTLIVWKQMEFMKNKDLGFVREQIIIIPLRDKLLSDKYAEIGTLLRNNPDILNVSGSMKPPTGISSSMGRKWPTKNGEQSLDVYHNQIDTNFLDLYQMKLVAGSNLSSASQKIDAVVNETLVRELGYTNDEVVGRLFARQWDSTRIVGVVADFHFQDFRLKIEPVDFKKFAWSGPQVLSVKVTGNNMSAVLADIEETLAGISEKYPFEYTFYDEWYGKTFISEAKTSKLMTLFSTVAIVIAALGLYGLILHMVNQRMKEIGIRKTLGAGSFSIIRLLSQRFGVLILTGYVVSCVIGYYGVTQWLTGFAYKISPTLLDFVITLAAIVAIAALAVYSRILVALRLNPATVLKQD